MSSETKVCPQCAETIQAAAVLCRYCKYRYDAPTAATAPASRRGMPAIIIVVILLACAVPLIAIVAAIAIPGLLSAQRASNERRAALALKTLATAEADFRANDRDGNQVQDYWTGDVNHLYSTVVNGQEIKLIDPGVAGADSSASASVSHFGYFFAAIPVDPDGKSYDLGNGRNPSRFAFCAYPATSASGKTTFIINEDYHVWSSNNGGQQLQRWPADPAAAGWRKFD